MKNILVTGGAGFIGSHLTRALVEQGNKVTVIDTLLRGNKLDKDILGDVNLVIDDVRNGDLIKKLSKDCEWIFHFAAVLGVDVVADNPVGTMDTEVIGLRNVTEAAMLNGVDKVIYASTSGVYGHSAIEKSATEEIRLDPRTSYAIAKRYNEIYLKALHEEKGLTSISVRFFNIYGQKQDNRMVIPRFIEQAKANEILTVFGDGKQTRDFTYIDDTVKSCLLLAEKMRGCDIYNVANEDEKSIFELATIIKKVTNSKSDINLVDAPKKRYDYEVERRFGSSTKLFEAIGYKPNTNLEEGLKRFV